MRGYSDIWAMINKLAGELETEDLKRVMCESVSEGRTDSLRELTGGELVKLRSELRERTGFKPQRANYELRRKRSLVLKQLERYGIDTENWDAVNAFVSDSRIAGKEFAELDEEELDQLRKKMYSINRKKRVREAEKANRVKPKRNKLVIYTSKPFNEIVGNSKYYN